MVTVLTIPGMLSIHAVRAIETALGAIPGITRAEVTLGQAVVEHADDVSPTTLIDAVAVAGFEVGAWNQERRRLPTL